MNFCHTAAHPHSHATLATGALTDTNILRYSDTEILVLAQSKILCVTRVVRHVAWVCSCRCRCHCHCPCYSCYSWKLLKRQILCCKGQGAFCCPHALRYFYAKWDTSVPWLAFDMCQVVLFLTRLQWRYSIYEIQKSIYKKIYLARYHCGKRNMFKELGVSLGYALTSNWRWMGSDMSLEFPRGGWRWQWKWETLKLALALALSSGFVAFAFALSVTWL